MAQTTITAVVTAIATNNWRLDGEHRVHVADSDGEYPLWHTEQSVRGAHTGSRLVGGGYIYYCVPDSNNGSDVLETTWCSPLRSSNN